MKKYVFLVLGLLIIISLLTLYYYNVGWIAYNIQKRQLSTLELIKYYTSIPFSNSTKIEKVEFSEDTEGEWDEYLEVVFLVPFSEIEYLFSERNKDYDKSSSVFERNSEDIVFSSIIFNTVRKWNGKTQRTINFTVMKPDEEYSKIYVSIDKLGWWLSSEWKLGKGFN